MPSKIPSSCWFVSPLHWLMTSWEQKTYLVFESPLVWSPPTPSKHRKKRIPKGSRCWQFYHFQWFTWKLQGLRVIRLQGFDLQLKSWPSIGLPYNQTCYLWSPEPFRYWEYTTTHTLRFFWTFPIFRQKWKNLAWSSEVLYHTCSPDGGLEKSLHGSTRIINIFQEPWIGRRKFPNTQFTNSESICSFNHLSSSSAPPNRLWQYLDEMNILIYFATACCL